MKTLVILLMMTLSGPAFSALGGDEIRNGGGAAEWYLTFALQNLKHSISNCLTKTTCAPSAKKRDVLKKILDSLEIEQKSEVLKFSSQKLTPGLFIIDGVVRLAVTGSRVWSPIYYNLDLLYQGNQVNMNYGQAVQSLIHELGHHHNVSDHDFLDRLGADVRIAENEEGLCRETRGFFCNEDEDKKVEWLCQSCTTMKSPLDSLNLGKWTLAEKNCYHRDVFQKCSDITPMSKGEFCNAGKVVEYVCGLIKNPGVNWVSQGDGCFHQITKRECK